MKNLTTAVLSLLTPEGADALFLPVDDTLTEKFGEKFEYWGKLDGHAAHNGSPLWTLTPKSEKNASSFLKLLQSPLNYTDER